MKSEVPLGTGRCSSSGFPIRPTTRFRSDTRRSPSPRRYSFRNRAFPIPVGPAPAAGAAREQRWRRAARDFVGGWDLTLNYLYHSFDDPVPFVAVQDGIRSSHRAMSAAACSGSPPRTRSAARHAPRDGHSTDRRFITTDMADPDRVFPADESRFRARIDNTALTDTLLSAQYFESHRAGSRALMTRSRRERQATFLVQRSFRNDSVRLRALWLHSLNRADGAVKARLSWQATADLSIGLSLERFYGDRLSACSASSATHRAPASTCNGPGSARDEQHGRIPAGAASQLQEEPAEMLTRRLSSR